MIAVGKRFAHASSFDLSPNGSGGWNQIVLCSFMGGLDGYNLASGVIFDSVGNLYGMAQYGGTNGAGIASTVFARNPIAPTVSICQAV